MKVTAESYLAAAKQAMAAAGEQQRETGSYSLVHYLSGLAVECILRAFAARLDEDFDDRHDLEQWRKKSKIDQTLPLNTREQFGAAFSTVLIQWSNSERYFSNELLRAYLRRFQQQKGYGFKGDYAKEFSRRILSAALEIVTLGEMTWPRLEKR